MGYPHVNGDMDGQQQKSWLMQSNGHHPTWESKNLELHFGISSEMASSNLEASQPMKICQNLWLPEPENFTLSPNCLTSW